jgi:hypothetical protein
MAVHGRIRGAGCVQTWSATAIVLIASLAATPIWSQQLPSPERRLLFEPSALAAEPGAFARDGGSLPPGSASLPDAQTRPGRDPNPFAPLRSSPPARATQAAPQFSRAIAGVPPDDKQPVVPGRTKIDRFSLGIETENRFRPDELPGGEKTHALTYQRELQVKPFLGLSLTSPIE